jgi:hypothetical protein
MAQQQLGQPVSAAHQIHADGVARANQVAQRLLLGARDSNRVQLARQQQPHQVLGVAAVGLDALPRRTRDLARRRDHALHAAPPKLARQAVAGRARLIDRAHRPRQPSAQPGRLADVTADPEELQLTGLGIEHRRDDLGRVHVQTDEASSLRHGRLLLFDCGPPRGGRRAASTPPRPLWGNRPLLPRRPDGPQSIRSNQPTGA